MKWSFSNDLPIYAQLVEQMKIGIATGIFPPGSRLPSVRDLAMEAGVNPNTMQRALAELERHGLVSTQRTSGRVVTEDMNMIKETRNMLAKEQIQEFIQRMRELGFEKEEILTLLKSEAGGEKNE